MPTLDSSKPARRTGDRGFLQDLIRPASDVPRAPIEQEDFDQILLERYMVQSGSGMLRQAYYSLKPLIPRPVQIAMRRRYAQMRKLQDGCPVRLKIQSARFSLLLINQFR